MNYCLHCRSGRHENCTGKIFEKSKKNAFIFKKRGILIETPNVCACTCTGIISEDNTHFKKNLGPDIRNEQKTDK